MNDPSLDVCGCCEGVEARTPESEKNPPGSSALVYRAGTYSTFFETLKAALPRNASLAGLTTRASDDPAIALLDAWAVVLDVLSFYQERVANEGFLHTATERRSVLELARSIGYELGPGVAASTFLAFTLDTPKDLPPAKATIPVGTKAQSVPGQDETPQLFETIEEIEARGDWNELTPQTRLLVLPKFEDTKVYLKGAELGLAPGDGLLIVGDERVKFRGSENWDFRRLNEVEAVRGKERVDDYTVVTLDRPLGSKTPRVEPAKKNVKVYALRQRASLFGYNALPWKALPESLQRNAFPDPHQWVEKRFDAGTTIINLDAAYPKITGNSWIVLTVPTYEELYYVTEAAEENKAEYLLAGKTTRLTIEGEHIQYFSPRATTVYGQSEPLEFAAAPISEPVKDESVILSALIESPPEGRQLAITGVDENTNQSVAEIATLKKAEPVGDLTKLTFTGKLAHRYKRDTVKINANVARATHGETKTEVLGSANGSTPFQTFELKQKPVTYIAAATASGAENTLELRVNNILWKEETSLYNLSPDARAYVTRRADDGRVTVEFGDGINGARPPSGQENITAKFRVGTGLAGLVNAGQISLLLTRPLGVKEVTNPLAPTGAGDPEVFADARQNAPLTVLTLERIVSLQDFEDFARAFAGIGKAQATALWNGEQQLVHITVAGPKGASVPEDSDLFKYLNAAIDRARHPDRLVRVSSFQPRQFNVVANILVDPSLIAADILAATASAVTEKFSFANRAFAQAVTESELVAVMQKVEGVVALDLGGLYFSSEPPKLKPRLPAQAARWSLNQIMPAELLTINPAGITLSQMTP